MDLHYFEKLDPDPHERQNSRALEARNGAVDAGKEKMKNCHVLKSWMFSLKDWKLLLEHASPSE
jgi:hypothetical protein